MKIQPIDDEAKSCVSAKSESPYCQLTEDLFGGMFIRHKGLEGIELTGFSFGEGISAHLSASPISII